jgi:hypothetical protein
MTALPPWISCLSPAGRSSLVHIAQQCSIDSQACLLERAAAGMPDSANSRQARHAHLARARSTVAAGAVFLAASEPDVLSFVLSRDFTWLRPFTADVQFKWRTLTPLLCSVTRERAERLFERGARRLFDLARRRATLDQLDVLRMQGAIVCLFPGPLLHPAAFVGPYQDLCRELEASELRRDPHLRIRLGALGGWLGQDARQIAGMFDPTLRAAGLADAYCFVRSDTRPDVYLHTARLLRGEAIVPSECLLPGRPHATLRSVVDYVRACLRDAQHLRSPGQALYLLAGLRNVEEHARELRAQGRLGSEVDALFARLRGFGSLQSMEKGRFWALCERLPESTEKRQLIELWMRDFGNEPVAERARERAPARSCEPA